jgi:nicotinamidase-related amidase
VAVIAEAATIETRLVMDLGASALIVVDMQNDFLATGGYYDVKDALFRARGGALDGDDLADLAAVHAHPPAAPTIRRGCGRLVDRVRRTAGAALAATSTFSSTANAWPSQHLWPPAPTCSS